MKTLYKTAMAVVAVMALTLTSCSEDDSAPVENNNIPTNSFTWTENGGAQTVADSAFYDSQYKTIKAFKGANMAKFVEVNLSADAPATYPVGSGYAVSYLNAGSIYAASAGSIVISAKSTTAMSGTITSTGSGAGVTSLNAQFTNIEVR